MRLVLALALFVCLAPVHGQEPGPPSVEVFLHNGDRLEGRLLGYDAGEQNWRLEVEGRTVELPGADVRALFFAQRIAEPAVQGSVDLAGYLALEEGALWEFSVDAPRLTSVELRCLERMVLELPGAPEAPVWKVRQLSRRGSFEEEMTWYVEVGEEVVTEWVYDDYRDRWGYLARYPRFVHDGQELRDGEVTVEGNTVTIRRGKILDYDLFGTTLTWRKGEGLVRKVVEYPTQREREVWTR